ncbi:hypothetical protein D910_04052 [Dendroctonus ponderosae]|uniref:Uncharacterized protein n=1 Tax=Dendroctonus ponderosae TaxID=77166 RepID=U4U7P6_DENPD|nr:hypothetical protein D910_04052 [Dendroctonus ponderosae]
MKLQLTSSTHLVDVEHLVHRAAPGALHRPHFQLLLDAVRGALPAHGARVGLHPAEQPLLVDERGGLGRAAAHHPDLCAGAGVAGRGRRAGHVLDAGLSLRLHPANSSGGDRRPQSALPHQYRARGGAQVAPRPRQRALGRRLALHPASPPSHASAGAAARAQLPADALQAAGRPPLGVQAQIKRKWRAARFRSKRANSCTMTTVSVRKVVPPAYLFTVRAYRCAVKLMDGVFGERAFRFQFVRTSGPQNGEDKV